MQLMNEMNEPHRRYITVCHVINCAPTSVPPLKVRKNPGLCGSACIPCLTLVFDLCKLFVVVLQCLTEFGVLRLNVVHPLELQLQLLSQLQHRYRIWQRQNAPH